MNAQDIHAKSVGIVPSGIFSGMARVFDGGEEGQDAKLVRWDGCFAGHTSSRPEPETAGNLR